MPRRPVPRSARPQRWRLAVGAAGALALAAIASALLTAPRWQDGWRDDPLARPVLFAHLLSVATAIVAGIWMTWRRPANRTGPIAVLLGVLFGAWYIGFFVLPRHGWWLLVSPVLVLGLRPLLFWLVLAFPIGRLDRVSRWAFAAFVAASSSAFVISTLTRSSDPEWPKVLGRWSDSTWTLVALSAWWDVGALFAAAAVLVIVQRRRLRFRTLGDHVGATAFWAAIVATGADFVLIGEGPVRDLQLHADHLTGFGMAVSVVDIGRWGAVVALLAIAARRAWPRDPAAGDSIELDDSGGDETLRAALAQALVDPGADVAVRDDASGWLDLAGRPRAEPGVDRAATIVVHDGEPIAALEYDDALVAHPAVIDAAVAALALQLESARQLALARNRETELRKLGVEVLDAEDGARRRLERNLHDGAQQALVGLSLQAALAARNDSGTDDVEELARSVDEVAAMLVAIATGRPPALLAERGLDGALGALVLTAGLPVTVDVDRCDGLPESMQRAVWFTAAEAVTNALKHAHASHLRVTLRRTDEEVTLTVADNGTGGVAHTPESLRWRVDDAHGVLDFESDESGTEVRATFAIAAGVPA